MKSCWSCKEIKPLSGFHKSKKSADGALRICKKCNCAKVRKWNSENKDVSKSNKLMKAYGISIEQYNDFNDFCGHECTICGAKESSFSRKLAVDHDHKTSVIRGLLCIKCNKGIGLFNDNPKLLRKAAEYLELANQEIKNAINSGEIESIIREEFKDRISTWQG